MPLAREPFIARRTGGRPQRFCSEHCRRASETTMREWARDQVAVGRVTLAEQQLPLRVAPLPPPTEALV
jgi:hypothetical protein